MSLTAQITRTILVTVAGCLVVVATANKATTQQQPERKTGSTIRGIVTYADTGRPLRFTTVTVVNNDTGQYLQPTVSDGRGQFVIRNLPEGRYLLCVDAPGILALGDYAVNMGSVTSQLRLHETRDLFTEVVVNGTDTVEVKVQGVRGGVITGRVVTDDDQPVANAVVKLLKRENDRWIPLGPIWSGASERNQMTDPSGVYRIAGLRAGEYVVRISESTVGFDGTAHEQDAYSNGSLVVAYYPAATNLKEAQAVSVIEGSESSGIDIRMPDRLPRTLSGSVTVGPNNIPAAFVEVLVEYPDELGFHSSLDVTTRADGQGKWVVNGVPPGQYVLRFGGSVRVGTNDSGGHIYLAPKHVPVTISNADVALNTRVAAAATIYGQVKIDGPKPDNLYGLRPAIVPATEGAERPTNDKGFRSHRGYSSTYVRDDGTFGLSGLATGKYWFGISGFEADKYYVKSATRKGVDISQRPIQLDEGTEFRDVLVTLGTDMASIEGQLSDMKTAAGETKTVFAEMIVLLAPANNATRWFSPGLRTTQPDDKGRFVFACGPGEYFLTVFTRAQREKLTTPISEEYFKTENQKFQRVKVRAGEKLKGLTLPIGVN